MITINIPKAKLIAHDKRRAARSDEFKPLDELIVKQIPGTDVAATEAARQAIRDKYAAMQGSIDSASSIAELKGVISAIL